MDILTLLKQQVNFSNLEKYIANYMLENSYDVMNMTLVELAKVTHTSTATISRFCKKLGINSYRDFRVIFLNEITNEKYKKIDYNKPFKKSDSLEKIAVNLESLYLNTVRHTLQLIDFNTLTNVIDLLNNAKKIDAYAVGMCYWSIKSFGDKLVEINKSLNINPIDYSRQAAFADENTVSLFVSYTGQIPKKMLDTVKNKGSKIVAITSVKDSYLRKNADYCIDVYSNKKMINKISNFSSRISIEYILDIIYSGIFQINYDINYINKIENEEKYAFNWIK